MQKKVLVGLSGGIDSSVTAAYFHSKGWEVIGLYLCLGDFSNIDDQKHCCHKTNTLLLGDQLDIPVHIVNYSEKFENRIINKFISQYKQAITPNPCVICNNLIKWKVLYEYSEKLDIPFIATGHYANISYSYLQDRYIIYKGIDDFKEQSYFLYRLSQKYLKRTLLPLGNWYKKDVKKYADDRDLPVNLDSESSGICFVPDDDIDNFLRKNLDEKYFQQGPIKTSSGEVVGNHDGVLSYTVGQRKGLNVPMGERYYVKEMLPDQNTLIIATREELLTQKFIVKDTNWVSIPPPQEEKIDCKTRVCYGQNNKPGSIKYIGDNRYEVTLEEPQFAVTPGQSAVFYRNRLVLGGGFIEERRY